MSSTDELLSSNEAYAANFTEGQLHRDRAHPYRDCGMLTFADDDVKAQIEEDTGIRPPFALEAFGDVEAHVRQSMARVHASPSSLTRTCADSSSTSPPASSTK